MDYNKIKETEQTVNNNCKDGKVIVKEVVSLVNTISRHSNIYTNVINA